ncbi:unnamed protein product [Larinioides sclopetarius]|uniref:Uncharacterized protein n=1 Tax=Larinioides sclopetarius TaxID=280406 RepID=A0AAV2ALK1_9ARAC
MKHLILLSARELNADPLPTLPYDLCVRWQPYILASEVVPLDCSSSGHGGCTAVTILLARTQSISTCLVQNDSCSYTVTLRTCL